MFLRVEGVWLVGRLGACRSAGEAGAGLDSLDGWGMLEMFLTAIVRRLEESGSEFLGG